MNKEIYYDINIMEIPLITLIDIANIEPPYIHYRRKADEYILYYVLSGEMYLTENNVNYILKSGDIIILDPTYEHYGTQSTICQYVYIHFNHSNIIESSDLIALLKHKLLSTRISSLSSNNTPSSNENTSMLLPKYFHISNNIIRTNIMCDFNRILESSKNRLECYSVKSGCILLELLINISREYISTLLYSDTIRNAKSQKIVQDMLTYFNEYYYEEISGDFIELKYNCNFDYINRVFKEATGKTIFLYLNELRINQAKLFFTTGYYKVSEVAEKVGFNDCYYFTKVFKKYTGITPSDYIKSLNI